MWRSKKFIIVAVLVGVLLAGSLGGMVLAQDPPKTQPASGVQTLMDRVIKIYQQKTGVAIDRAKLDESFTQARREMQEEALKTRLQTMVKNGKLTQDQADQYLKWWQSRPNVPLGTNFGPGHGPRGQGRGFPGPMMRPGSGPGPKPPPPQPTGTPRTG